MKLKLSCEISINDNELDARDCQMLINDITRDLRALEHKYKYITKVVVVEKA